jgi:uncharacterized protein Usg
LPEKILGGHRLTTAEITYHLPDHPGLLQQFIWQRLDVAPQFPELRRFLDYWQRNLDGKLHSVRVVSSAVARPAGFRSIAGAFRLH